MFDEVSIGGLGDEAGGGKGSKVRLYKLCRETQAVGYRGKIATGIGSYEAQNDALHGGETRNIAYINHLLGGFFLVVFACVKEDKW